MRVFPSAAQTPDTLALILGMFDELVAGGVTDEEVAFAKSYLAGTWAFELDTAPARLERRLEAIAWGLNEAAPQTFRARLAAVTRATTSTPRSAAGSAPTM